MADKHPYIPAPGILNQTINQFRKSFPQSVTSDTLKKLAIAPKNESRVINVFRFLGFVDQEGKKTEIATKVFSSHIDEEFYEGFGKQVRNSYKQLFELHQESTWDLDINALISFFRANDDTTELVGKLQAQTFQVLGGFSGHEKNPVIKTPTTKSTKPLKTKAQSTNGIDLTKIDVEPKINNKGQNDKRNFGLTVRIEVNLPADGSQETYDRIFRSIRENLLNE